VDAVARQARPGDHHAAGLDSAFALLNRAQAKAPDVTAETLALPQVGAWAMTCLESIHSGMSPVDGFDDPHPLWVDLGYLNAVAASAALRAGLPFDLVVPIRHGRLAIPGIGMADIRLTQVADDPVWDLAQIRSTRCTPIVDGSQAEPPMEIFEADGTQLPIVVRWIPVHRVRVEASGLVLDVTLDNQDPFLGYYGHPVAATWSQKASEDVLSAWTELLVSAWRLIADHHRIYATAIAAGLRTIVPLATQRAGDRIAATSCLAFGAVGIGIPRTAVILAESLVHEFQHVKLGAIADVDDLFTPGPNTLVYAPWRDDPRPYDALLQGAYAHAGVAGFWRTERYYVPAEGELAANVEFARWRSGALHAARTLAASSRLTRSGERLVRGLILTLRRWQSDPVPQESLRIAQEMLAAHRLDWRVRHLRPSAASVEMIARSWEQDCQTVGNVDTHVVACRDPEVPDTRIRRQMLELRYRDPPTFLRWQCGDHRPDSGAGSHTLDAADSALVNGDNGDAEAEYRRRIAADGRDPGAWSGLSLIAWRRARKSEDFDAVWTRLRPELSRALYLRLCERSGRAADPTALITWTGRLQPRARSRTTSQQPAGKP